MSEITANVQRLIAARERVLNPIPPASRNFIKAFNDAKNSGLIDIAKQYQRKTKSPEVQNLIENFNKPNSHDVQVAIYEREHKKRWNDLINKQFDKIEAEVK